MPQIQLANVDQPLLTDNIVQHLDLSGPYFYMNSLTIKWQKLNGNDLPEKAPYNTAKMNIAEWVDMVNGKW